MKPRPAPTQVNLWLRLRVRGGRHVGTITQRMGSPVSGRIWRGDTSGSHASSGMCAWLWFTAPPRDQVVEEPTPSASTCTSVHTHAVSNYIAPQVTDRRAALAEHVRDVCELGNPAREGREQHAAHDEHRDCAGIALNHVQERRRLGYALGVGERVVPKRAPKARCRQPLQYGLDLNIATERAAPPISGGNGAVPVTLQVATLQVRHHPTWQAAGAPRHMQSTHVSMEHSEFGTG